MGLPYETAAYTLIGMATRFQDFFYAPAQDVTFEYMNEDGEVKTATVPNVAKIKSQLDAEAVTDAELSDTLKSYYTNVEVDAIRDAIMDNFDNYYTKAEVGSIAADLSKTTYLNKSGYEKNVLTNYSMFDSSGIIYRGSTDSENVSTGLPLFTDIEYSTDKPSMLFIGNKNTNGSATVTNNAKNITFNVNGHLITVDNGSNVTDDALFNASSAYVKFPDAPTLSNKVISDIKNAPSLEQGEFAFITDTSNSILDYPTDLSENPIDAENVNVEAGAKVVYDADNKQLEFSIVDSSVYHVFYFAAYTPIIYGVRYEVIVEIERVNCSDAYVNIKDQNNNTYLVDNIEDGVHTYELTCDGEIRFAIRTDADDANGEKIIIKQLGIRIKEPAVVAPVTPFKGGNVFSINKKFQLAKTIARKDLVFKEVWQEKIAEKDFVYPYGNTQFVGNTYKNLKNTQEGTFDGADTYSLFGTWEQPGSTVGKGYKWSELTLDEQLTLANDEENNIYKDGDTWIQVRYRFRTVKGGGNKPYNYFNLDIVNELSYVNNVASVKPKGKLVSIVSDLATDSVSTAGSIEGQLGGWFDPSTFNNADRGTANGAYNVKHTEIIDGVHTLMDISEYTIDGEAYAVPIAVVQRLNDGVYHPSYNPDGTARIYYGGKAVKWFTAAFGTITSITDCFNTDLIAAVNKTDVTDVVKLTDADTDTYISTAKFQSRISSRPDAIFSNEINTRLVENKIIDAKTPEMDEMITINANNIDVGTFIGKEDTVGFTQWRSTTTLGSQLHANSNTFKAGNSIIIYTKNYPLKRTSIDPELYSIGRQYYIMDEQGRYLNFEVKNKEINGRALLCTIISNTMPASHFQEMEDGTSGFYRAAVKLFISSNISDTVQNGRMTYTEFIGDPRPLKYRLRYDLADTNSGNVAVDNYVLDTDGTYYISLEDRGDLSNIHDDISDNSSKWLNLGTNGDIGGLPKDMLSNGMNADLNINSFDDNKYSYPTKPKIKNFVKNGISINYVIIRLNRKVIKGEEIVFYNSKTGERKQLSIYDGHDGQTDPAADAVNEYGYMAAISTASAYAQDVIDTVSIVVDYTDTNGNKTVLIDANDVVYLTAFVSYTTIPLYLKNRWPSKSVYAGGIFLTNYRNSFLGYCLTNRKLTGTYNDTANRYITNVQYWNYCGMANGILATSWLSIVDEYYLMHDDIHIDGFRMFDSIYGIKTIPFLTVVNNRYMIGFLYKEIKNNGTTWGDDNRFQLSEYQNYVTNAFGAKVAVGVKCVELPYYKRS